MEKRHLHMTAVAILMALALTTCAALGQEGGKSLKERNARAIELSKADKLLEAIDIWLGLIAEVDAAFAHRWVFHKNVGRNFQKLGRYPEAWVHLAEAVRLHPKQGVEATWLAEVEALLQRGHRKVRLSADRLGSEARLGSGDQAAWRALPTEWWFPPGAHVVTVRALSTPETDVAMTVEEATDQVRLVFPRVGQLRVEAQPREAAIFLDGARVGDGDVRMEVPTGPHAVKVFCEGFHPHAEDVEVQAGLITAIEVNLQPVAIEPPPTVTERPPVGVGPGRAWKWVLWGSAVAVAAGGGGTYAYALSAADDQRSAHNRWVEKEYGLGGAVPAGSEAAVEADWDRRLDDEVAPWEVTSYALWGTAGALAVTGTVVWLLEDDSAPGEQVFRLLPLMGPGNQGVSAQWTF